MDLTKFMKKSPKVYKMADSKECQVCKKPISMDDTPRHLFYGGFCSDKCKDKYISGN